MADQPDKYYLVEYWNDEEQAHKFFALLCSKKDLEPGEIADRLAPLHPEGKPKITYGGIEIIRKILLDRKKD